jgi:hypothetical protein
LCVEKESEIKAWAKNILKTKINVTKIIAEWGTMFTFSPFEPIQPCPAISPAMQIGLGRVIPKLDVANGPSA